MLKKQADPSNLAALLQTAQDGYTINLAPGVYKGPFTIDRKITVSGSGITTEIFTVDEPCLVVKVSGVRLENLAIARSLGGEVISVSPDNSPILTGVKLTGVATNVQWEKTTWNIPQSLDLGEITTNLLTKFSWEIEIGAACKVISNVRWLQLKSPILSPGKQTLEGQLNTTNILPGTLLSGAIFFMAAETRYQLNITAKITPVQPKLNLKEITKKNPPETIISENWGYIFLGQAIDNFIRDMAGETTLEKYPQFNKRRQVAVDLMGDILQDNAYFFYVRRQSKGEKPGEEIWGLTLVTDLNDVSLPPFLEERKKTLNLSAVVSEHENQGLKLISARLLPKEKGIKDDFSLLYSLRLLPNRSFTLGIPKSTFKQITAQPFCGEIFPTEEQLKAWRIYVEIERRLVELRQFCVGFQNHNLDAVTRKITFEINVNSATIDGTKNNSLTPEGLWLRVTRAIKEEINLFEQLPENGEKGQLLGYIETIEPLSNLICVNLNSEAIEQILKGDYQLPPQGVLCFTAAGDIIQIQRKEKALQELEQGKTQNRYLGNFFFNSALARLPENQVKIKQDELLLPTANRDQISAVKTVLSTPDLALIQGPPGTGKTTVIAEICYQVALRGGRTLITAQANLAVDNALSRLIHSPIIRAVRKGKPERVEEEGLPFLEEQAINKWLKDTANDCEKRLEKSKNDLVIFRQLLQDYPRFVAYLEAEEIFKPQYQELTTLKQSLEATYTRENMAYQEGITKYKHLKLLHSFIEELLASPNLNWETPVLESLLAFFQSELDKNEVLQQFFIRVNEAANLATELGFVVPNTNLFALAICLTQLLPEIAEIKSIYPAVDETVRVMFELQTSARIFKQEDKTLEFLKQKLQEFRKYETKLQEELLEFNNRQEQIAKLTNKTTENGNQTSEALKNQFTIVLNNAKADELPPNINFLANQTLKSIAIHTNSQNKWLNQLKIKTDRAIEEIEYKLQRLGEKKVILEKQIAANESQGKAKTDDAVSKFRGAIASLQNLVQLPQLPQVLRNRSQHYLNNLSYLAHHAAPEFVQEVRIYKIQLENLENIISSLNPKVILSTLQTTIETNLSTLQQTTQNHLAQLTLTETKLREIEPKLAELMAKINEQRQWWQSAIPEYFQTEIPDTGIFSTSFLTRVKEQFLAWKIELEKTESYLKRYGNLMQDWINKLRHLSSQEQDELKRIYLENANVVGITCSQAAGYNFTKEFNNFDVVIIDEVSKCTPPEILIPALKARKLVLIGDYHQLPPMLNTETIEELAFEMGTIREDLGFLSESLFKKQFETASPKIKQMLTIQYRMHPQIMGAINQFYDYRLQCGIIDPDTARAHHLSGKIIKEDQHLIWVTIPQQKHFEEQQQGTSFVNPTEVEVIAKLCKEMEQTWKIQVAAGKQKKEIGIITFYLAQLRLIEETIDPQNFPSLKIRMGTVDRFQGMEKPVIIVSLVRNNSRRQMGFARKPERVNVAFSRAQELLIIVGCHSLFTQYPGEVGRMYSEVYDFIDSYQGVIDPTKKYNQINKKCHKSIAKKDLIRTII